MIRSDSNRRRIPAGALLIFLALATPRQAGATEFHIHGILDLAAAERGRAFDHNVLTRGDSPFDPYGLRVFGDAQVTERLQIYSQVVLRDATSPYVDGAYLLFTPSEERDLHVMAGKTPWPIGTYAPRTYSNRNPLIGTPLMYQYHTTLLWFDVVPSADALLATAGSGQYGAGYEGYPEGPGMPIIDDSYWDVGATLTGSERPFEYAAGVFAGTPSWGSTSQDDNSGKSVLGRIGYTPLPGMRFGLSGAYGPYLHDSVRHELPPGSDPNDFNQKLAMADIELAAGHVEVRAEGARNAWETPTVGDLKVTSGYLEGKYSLFFGAFLAGRIDAMRFGEIADSTGTKYPWDGNVTRFEVGGGYRFSRNTQAKIVYQHTTVDIDNATSSEKRRLPLTAAQLSIIF